MVGRKTHEQQQRIIAGKETTKGGGSGFPAADDLKASPELRKARAKGGKLTTPAIDLADADDRNMVRGRNQENRRQS